MSSVPAWQAPSITSSVIFLLVLRLGLSGRRGLSPQGVTGQPRTLPSGVANGPVWIYGVIIGVCDSLCQGHRSLDSGFLIRWVRFLSQFLLHICLYWLWVLSLQYLGLVGLEQLVYCPSYMLPNGIMSDIECWHVHIVPNGLCGLVLGLHSINQSLNMLSLFLTHA